MASDKHAPAVEPEQDCGVCGGLACRSYTGRCRGCDGEPEQPAHATDFRDSRNTKAQPEPCECKPNMSGYVIHECEPERCVTATSHDDGCNPDERDTTTYATDWQAMWSDAMRVVEAAYAVRDQWGEGAEVAIGPMRSLLDAVDAFRAAQQETTDA